MFFSKFFQTFEKSIFTEHAQVTVYVKNIYMKCRAAGAMNVQYRKIYFRTGFPEISKIGPFSEIFLCYRNIHIEIMLYYYYIIEMYLLKVSNRNTSFWLTLNISHNFF